ncbi:alcohol dehydrogenase catalytic domain-containing protein [Streptomyces sp. NPDC002537]
MRATFMYGAGDVRVEDAPDPVLEQPTDAIVRACICGSDLHPYHTMPASEEPAPMGHEFLGIVEDVGSDVSGLKRGDLAVAPFAWADNTCGFCREGLQTSCRNGGFWDMGGTGGGQAEAVRVPLAEGTLVKLPVTEDSELLPSLLTLSDVYGTGYHAAKRARVNPRTTVTVIGDGAVRPGGVISRVGMPQYEEAPVGFTTLFGPNITLTGGPAPVRAYIDELLPDVLEGKARPGRVFDRTVGLAEVPDGYRAMDRRQALKVLVKP